MRCKIYSIKIVYQQHFLSYTQAVQLHQLFYVTAVELPAPVISHPLLHFVLYLLLLFQHFQQQIQPKTESGFIKLLQFFKLSFHTIFQLNLLPRRTLLVD